MTAPPTKVCSLCKQDLPTTDFYRHPHASLGVASKCKACALAYGRVAAKAYYQANRERILARCKERAAKLRAAKIRRGEKARAKRAAKAGTP